MSEWVLRITLTVVSIALVMNLLPTLGPIPGRWWLRRWGFGTPWLIFVRPTGWKWRGWGLEFILGKRPGIVLVARLTAWLPASRLGLMRRFEE